MAISSDCHVIDLWDGQVPLAEQQPSPLMKVEPEVEFFAPGRPAPQGSKTYAGIIPANEEKGTKARPRMRESSRHLPAWRDAVRTAATEAMAGRDWILGDLSLGCRFTFLRPASHYRADGVSLNAEGQRTPYPKGPDLDKLLRSVMDPLTQVVYRDDRQVALMDPPPCRVWGERSGCHVVVRRLW